ELRPSAPTFPAPPYRLWLLGVPGLARRFARRVPLEPVVYSTAIAPPPPVPQYAPSPPRASIAPAPPTVPALTHTDPPAPPRSLYPPVSHPFARIAPSTTTVPAITRTIPPPDPPLPAPPPTSCARSTLPYVVPTRLFC